MTATVETLTLSEFLLARIAEDELLCRNAMGVPEWWPARVLAECDAKRRIVEDFTALHADYQVTHSPTTEARRIQAVIAASHLAAVYADHPDYRDEWKP